MHNWSGRPTAPAVDALQLSSGLEFTDPVVVNSLPEAEYAAKDPFYKKVIDSQKKYAELVVPYRLSWYPPYDFAGKYYWKDKIYLKSGKDQ